MICKNCGNEIDGTLPFCPYCGSPTAEKEPPEQAPTPEQAPAPEQSPTPEQAPAPEQAPSDTVPPVVICATGQQAQPAPGQPIYLVNDAFGGFPMKWHKFLVYFGVWAMAVTSFITAVTYLTGSTYGALRELVYDAYLFLQAADIVYGATQLACAALGVYTALMLLNQKKIGPAALYCLLIGSTLSELIYSGLLLVVTGGESYNARFLYAVQNSEAGFAGTVASMIITTGISALIIVLNVIYYGKRKQFFTK